MRGKRVAGLLLVGGLLLAGLAGLAAAQSYGPGFKFIKVPDPLSGTNPNYRLIALPLPRPGQSFWDNRFRTRLTRVTQGTEFRHEYARFDPFNADHSMIILFNFEPGDYVVFRTASAPYNTSAQKVMTFSLEEPRWDPRDPQVIWALDKLKIVKLDLRTQRRTVVKDFAADPAVARILRAEPDIYRVTTKHEGEASLDLRYWGLALQGTKDDHRLRYLLCWDRQTDAMVGLRALSAQEAENIDWVGMSPLGRWVIIGADDGLFIAGRDLRSQHRIAAVTAHSDVGLDSGGREIMVMQNPKTDHIDLIPLEADTRPVTSQEGYRASRAQPLIQLFYSSDSPHSLSAGVHISCNTPGYCLISTYNEPGQADKNWLDRTITLVRLDRQRPAIYYLAKVHGVCGAYWEETQATISRDGSRVVWASNWGREPGKEKVFVMQLTMPPDWRRLTGGKPPLP